MTILASQNGAQAELVIQKLINNSRETVYVHKILAQPYEDKTIFTLELAPNEIQDVNIQISRDDHTAISVVTSQGETRIGTIADMYFSVGILEPGKQTNRASTRSRDANAIVIDKDGIVDVQKL